MTFSVGLALNCSTRVWSCLGYFLVAKEH